MRDTYAIILAAGKGSGMASNNPNASKVAYPILGKPLVNYVIDAAKPLINKDIFVVVGFGGEKTKECVKNDAKVVWQKEVLGTGHAAMQASEFLKDKDGDVFIINGDTPLLTSETLQAIYKKHIDNGNQITICTSVLENPNGYGRVIREYPSRKILAVRPDAELSENERDEINEINSGIYVVDNCLLQKYLSLLNRNNKKNEYYLSDIVELMVSHGFKAGAYVLPDAYDVYNINNRIQLAYAARVMRKRINQKLMLSGVSIEDPRNTYISPDVKIGKDTVILPNTSILGNTEIGSRCHIGPNSILENVKVGNDAVITSSVLRNTEIKDKQVVGPFEKIC